MKLLYVISFILLSTLMVQASDLQRYEGGALSQKQRLVQLKIDEFDYALERAKKKGPDAEYLVDYYGKNLKAYRDLLSQIKEDTDVEEELLKIRRKHNLFLGAGSY